MKRQIRVRSKIFRPRTQEPTDRISPDRPLLNNDALAFPAATWTFTLRADAREIILGYRLIDEIPIDEPDFSSTLKMKDHGQTRLLSRDSTQTKIVASYDSDDTCELEKSPSSLFQQKLVHITERDKMHLKASLTLD